MNARSALIILLGSTLAAPAAHAQSTLDKYQARNTQSDAAGAQTTIAGVKKVFESADGYWRVDDNRAAGGSCSVTYVAGSNTAGYVAPTSGSEVALIVLSGPDIPPMKAVKNKAMTLYAASNGATQAVEAFHAPNTAEKGSGIHFSDTQYGAADNRVDILGRGGQVGQTSELDVTSRSRKCSRTPYLEEGGVGVKAYRVFDFSMEC